MRTRREKLFFLHGKKSVKTTTKLHNWMVTRMDKMRIVICDEAKQEAEGYAKICRSICERCDATVEIKIYDNSSELLFDLKDDAFCALMSILIVEPEGSFAEIPAMARQEGYDGLILYLSHSTLPERYHQAFDTDSYNFVQKGTGIDELARFQTVFEKAVQTAKHLDRQYVVLSCGGEYRQIDIKDIYYFESAAEHMISVEYRGGDFKFPSTLNNLEERLSDRGFVRTHRSYIVALASIGHFNFKELALNNGRKLPVSRTCYAGLKAAMDKWKI